MFAIFFPQKAEGMQHEANIRSRGKTIRVVFKNLSAVERGIGAGGVTPPASPPSYFRGYSLKKRRKRYSPPRWFLHGKKELTGCILKV